MRTRTKRLKAMRARKADEAAENRLKTTSPTASKANAETEGTQQEADELQMAIDFSLKEVQALEQENKCLEELLAESGLRKVETLGDGSCLYRAVGMHTRETAEQVRLKVAEWLRQNPNFAFNDSVLSTWLQDIDGATWTEFCDHVADLDCQRRWGGELVILAIAQVYQTPVLVWSPDFNAHNDGSICLEIRPEVIDYNVRTIHIAYRHLAKHFEAVFPVNVSDEEEEHRPLPPDESPLACLQQPRNGEHASPRIEHVDSGFFVLMCLKHICFCLLFAQNKRKQAQTLITWTSSRGLMSASAPPTTSWKDFEATSEQSLRKRAPVPTMRTPAKRAPVPTMRIPVPG